MSPTIKEPGPYRLDPPPGPRPSPPPAPPRPDTGTEASDRYTDVWRRAYWAHREVPGRHHGECCQDRCWPDIGRRVLDEMVPKVQAWLGEPEVQPNTGTEALAWALHKTRPSNEAPEYDMTVARERAAAIVAQLPADTGTEALRAVAFYAGRVMAALEQYGPSIVPHLLDTDDNDGQRLREALERARPVSSEGSDG